MSACATCSDPQGDGTCAACCLEGVAYDAAGSSRRLREIAAMTPKRAQRAALAWAEELDRARDEAISAVRDMREDPTWEP